MTAMILLVIVRFEVRVGGLNLLKLTYLLSPTKASVLTGNESGGIELNVVRKLLLSIT
jgi:hypothetical protein